MREKKKRKIPIAIKIILIVLAAIVLSGAGIFAKMRYEQSVMTPLGTGKVITGVYAVSNRFVNFYLVQNDDDSLMKVDDN